MKAKKLIIQCGRLDSRYNEQFLFRLKNENTGEDYPAKAALSSHFLVSTVPAFKDANILFIFPISIFHQNWSKVKDAIKEDPYLTEISNLHEAQIVPNIHNLLSQHPHLKQYNHVVVSAVGTYAFNDTSKTFDADINYISTQIYLELISKFSYDELEEVYIDISSGQNIYVAALINAIYRFLPYVQMKRLHLDTNSVLKAFIVNADPIYPGIQEVSIRLSEFRAKAFNTLIINQRGQLSSLLSKFDNATKKLLKNIIETEYPILHTCLMKGFILGITLLNKELIKSFFDNLCKIENTLVELFSAKSEKANVYKFDYFQVISLTFTIVLFNSLVNLIEKKITCLEGRELHFDIHFNNTESISADFDFKNEGIEALYQLLEKNFGLIKPPYKGEIEKLKITIKEGMQKGILEEFNSIAELEEKIFSRRYNPSFLPRNFFAHEGMEKTITCLQVKENKLRLKYNSNAIDKIKDSISKYAFKEPII